MIHSLEKDRFDVVVIRGGCTGSMIALDASLRGYKVALLEKNDFSSGTSSRSTNLLHGGIRYLENAVKHLDWGEFKLVREALHERQYMLQNAPYITRPIATVLPTNSWFQQQYMRIGLRLYDWIAHRGGLPSRYSLESTAVTNTVLSITISITIFNTIHSQILHFSPCLLSHAISLCNT